MRSGICRRAGYRLALMLTVLVLTFGASAPSAGAQQERPREGARPERQRTEAERSAMVRELHARLASTVKRELHLTDAQAARLQATNSRIDGRRRPLLQRERALRSGLRKELQRGQAADDREVAGLLDGLLSVHRQKLELLEAEQRELAQFLTPVQRARYFSLQENWRRHGEEEAERDRGRRGRRPGS
ncbi:MAG: hypothetical protein ACYC2G_00185 [Gemmatimonadaceae bacterium]